MGSVDLGWRFDGVIRVTRRWTYPDGRRMQLYSLLYPGVEVEKEVEKEAEKEDEKEEGEKVGGEKVGGEVEGFTSGCSLRDESVVIMHTNNHGRNVLVYPVRPSGRQEWPKEIVVLTHDSRTLYKVVRKEG
ncbi:hypothetical protein ADUPG1_007375 [Aduncisulcus paluster]|uniref:Uncharacterized protein n=1 Tax=Aduncisulcus paluster TaxID=2918883 RepID=A0ABQ5KLV3_9EUKA|nr:hypothetical protein ADUPG1_007364 [Aduncisulcus paluster]GKT33485.1 hypothetical protein ADUPG1_007375 [Aduncisulcus paluster]